MKRKFSLASILTGAEDLFTHQLPRAFESCCPELLKQHPQLAGIENDLTKDNWQEWIAEKLKTLPSTLEVEPLKEFQHKDPLTEAVEIFGKDRVIVAKL